MAGPEIVPPGAEAMGREGLANTRATVPDLEDRETALRRKHLRERGVQEPPQVFDSQRRLPMPLRVERTWILGIDHGVW
jgi:hypothetical protein